jgi:hypothetical protein
MIKYTFTTQKPKILITRGNKMKKIILTVILSSLLPAIAVADDHVMRNDNPNASVMKGKHMMNTHTSESDIDMKSKKHMSMGDNPFSSHDKKVATKTNQVHKGYTVIKYKK